MGPGTRSHFGGRSDIQSVIRTTSFLLPKQEVAAQWQLSDGPMMTATVSAGVPLSEQLPTATSATRKTIHVAQPQSTRRVARVPLGALAIGRSGDKGNDANIGLMARDPAWLPIIGEQVTADRVRDYFAHLIEGPVTRYELSGIGAFNFVLERALGGGGSCSLRSDPLGKCYAQMLLDMEIECPADLLPPGAAEKP